MGVLCTEGMACDNRTRLYYSGSALSVIVVVVVVVVSDTQISAVVRTKAVSPAADSCVQTKENRIETGP